MIWKLKLASAWVVPHVIVLLYGWETMSAFNVLLFVVFYVLAVFGGTTGYHRYLAHEGFECGNITKFVLLSLGTLSMMGTPLQWAATHKAHHEFEDTDKDPHSPQNGFFHAYIGWMFDGSRYPPVETAAKMDDPVVSFISKHYDAFVVASLLIAFLIGGFGGLVWGGFVRMVALLHVVGVSSTALHMGKHNGKNNAKDCWWAALLTLGEGWHKYHHTVDEHDPRHGRQWWQIDVNWYVIALLAKIGLVRIPRTTR